jgi:predicted RNase H-like HicB family nuclease
MIRGLLITVPAEDLASRIGERIRAHETETAALHERISRRVGDMPHDIWVDDGLEHSQASWTEAMKYLIVIEQAGTGFSAYSPDRPGCIATGSTRDEVEREMKGAIAFHLDGLKAEGLLFRNRRAPRPTSRFLRSARRCRNLRRRHPAHPP